MLLREVRLCVRIDDFGSDYASDFLFASCYVSNFMTRRARGLRRAVDGFGRMFVEGAKQGDKTSPFVAENYAITPVPFEAAEFDALDIDGRHEFLVKMLTAGIEKASATYDIPSKPLFEAVTDFRRGGYRNEWEHSRRILRAIGVRASLLCSLDPVKFVLKLKLERAGSVVFESAILETKPDELVFHHRFADTIFDGEAIVVRDKFGEPIYAIDPATIEG